MPAQLLWTDQIYAPRFIYAFKYDSILTDVVINDDQARTLHSEQLPRRFRYHTILYQYDFSGMRSLLDDSLLSEYKGIMFIYLYGFPSPPCSLSVDWRKEGF
jgi:hypothetical protein